ncbi:MAG: hypothetical protein DWQ05_09655 [Calditrichaeota bacterium]|nr:MAG: hypothetical protein DWQ05_09655 [Calditrichota bacterium]
MKKIFVLFMILIFVLPAESTAIDEIKVKKLRCEYLKNPLGIDIGNPHLSWIIESKQPKKKQTAYQILAASSKEKLKENKGDLWDSGKVESNKSIHIKYSGNELIHRQQVFWKVRIWDETNSASSWSEIAQWEMGLLASDWLGKWVGMPEEKQQIGRERNPAPYFRKDFVLSKSVKSARIYISGLGYYELSINGMKIGDHVLSPNHTNYDKRQSQDLKESRVKNMATRVLYESFDVTAFLNSGNNAIGVCLGNGWYFQNDRNEDEPLSYDTPRFIAQMEIELIEGSKEIIISDTSWKTAYGPILHNGLYNGEIYDARRENPGWNESGFDDSNWSRAQIVRAPEGKLMAQMSPPDRIIKTIKPVSITIPEKGVYRYDMGQLISGWVRLKLSGARGDTIKLKFIEEFGFTFGQTDTYILKGDSLETWEPRFTWHAFRYVDVLNAPMTLTIESLEGRIVNTDVDSAGTFSCSNPLFNDIYTHFQWTQLGNMHGGVPSDCPHRERRGYTGDGQIAAQAAIYSFDMASFYTKWLDDIKDAQNSKTGYVPNTAPYQSGGGGTAWGSAYIIIPWHMYQYYGDVQVLAEHYSGMKKWLNFLEHLRDENGILIEKNLGEWVPPYPTEVPPSLVSTAYYFHDLNLLTKIAKVLDKQKDAAIFEELAKATQIAFHRKYFDHTTNNYSIGRQGANVFALGFGLVPAKHQKQVFANLVENIEVRTKGHFDTGMLGTPLLLDVLTENGRTDLAYTVMNRRDFPSFGYNISRGATTIWETWGGSESHSHPMFGSVCQWFFQGLAGINPDPDSPGFKHIILKPKPVGSLKFVKATYNSMHGNIESHWQTKNGDFIFETRIPANTTASVYIPATGRNKVTVTGGDASFVGIKNNLAHFEISAGRYSFFSKNVSDLIKNPMLSAPVISPGDKVILAPNPEIVNITSEIEDAEIRFTLDGSEPDLNSQVFKQPFELDKSAIISARVYKKGYKPGPIKSARIIFIDPEVNGIDFSYFEGTWKKVPDFDLLSPTKSGIVYEIDLQQVNPKSDKFALIFTGKLEISKPGDYTFYLNSNDGSNVFIDNKLVVDNDGLHGSRERSGMIKLTQGMHAIKITYFQAGGGMHLQLSFSSPEIEKQEIPALMFFKSN